MLRVLTWNIGRIYMVGESRAADRLLPHVAEVILRSDAQLVALQELRDCAQLGRLLELLLRDAPPGACRWRGRLTEDAYDRRPALLFRGPCDFFDLPTRSGRIAQGAFLPSWQLAVASLHIDAFSARRRRGQLEDITRALLSRRAASTMLVGDFNADPADPASAELVAQLDASGYLDLAPSAGKTTLYGLRLDQVWLSEGALSGADSQVLVGCRRRMMDHDPLLVTVSRLDVLGGLNEPVSNPSRDR
jgi:endonuclease/exonuclease/phosphatase family metal-dependent hydrolase